MSIYAPIAQRLKNTKKDIVSMTFAEIEAIINRELPPSARKYRAWWSNDTSTHTQAFSWLEAGYATERVDMKSETLVFRRATGSNAPVARDDKEATPSQPLKPYRHPMFGCMKGLITIPDDLDLTEPADPDWGKRTYGENK